MALARLQAARKRMVGSKQTLKAISRGQARVVFVAANADQHVVDPIVRACAEKGIEVVQVDNIKNLGRACGIDVGCASAAIIDD
ncbi:MAG: ribosomal L7Ae/L30e/S12e/Gadd45 family protein [Bacillota bacterium]|jgi:large subunit ribosomal protein L7A